MNLNDRYKQIQDRFEEANEFPSNDQEKSRALFDMIDHKIIPKKFDVWTCLVGLPVPADLTRNLEGIVTQVTEYLPSNVRFYKVIPNNYHWEVFIIKRPDEIVSTNKLKEAEKLLSNVVSKYKSFSISYKGFLITTEGTIIVKGYGDFSALREELRSTLPFASKFQSPLGHMSLGRILDPVGAEVYMNLKELVRNSLTTEYGQLYVNKVKYVHETQWYMENRTVIQEFDLQGETWPK